MGYHPGLEDDGVYLTAVKADLNPALYPYNADFFRLQMEATVFDKWMARFVRGTGMPVAWAELFWQLVSLFLILWAVKRSRTGSLRKTARDGQAWPWWPPCSRCPCRAQRSTWWTSICTRAIWPRPDSAGGLADPRAKALAGGLLLLMAFLLHPLMAAMGISFCFFLTMALPDSVHLRLRSVEEFGSGICVSASGLGLRAGGSRRGARRWTREPTITSSNGPGTSGWARWRRCFFSGCCGASHANAERFCWRGLPQPCLPTASSNSFWPWRCSVRLPWCG